MIRNKIILTTLLVLSLISIFYFFFIQNDIKGDLNPKNISFTLSSNHREYLKGEYIWINTRISNNSDQNYYIKGDFALGGSLEFIIKNSKGQIVPKPSMDFFNFQSDDSLLFQPNDTLESMQNLDWYNLGGSNLSKEYSIVAKYNDLTSNEITFIVNEPVGDEKKIYDFINKYDNERVFKKEYGQYLDNEAIALMNQFPNSRYLPIIYEQLLSMFFAYYPDPSYFDKYFDKYMRSNMDDVNMNTMLNIYRAKLSLLNGDRNFIKTKLEELKTTYGTNAFLNNEIDKYIKRNVDYEKYWFKK